MLITYVIQLDLSTAAGDGSSTLEDNPVRNLSTISDMIRASGLPTAVKERSIQVFTALGEAEAKTHGSTLDQVCLMHSPGAARGQ